MRIPGGVYAPAEYGINLMACFFIVYHHGGKIEASSEEGQGTKFTIRLPLDPKRAIRPEKGEDFLKRVASSEKVWRQVSSGH